MKKAQSFAYIKPFLIVFKGSEEQSYSQFNNSF